MDQASMRDQAIALAEAGFRVFPLVEGGKRPMFEGWQDAASSDPKRAHAVWSEALSGDPLGYNIGIATGHGLFVLDVDDKNGKHGSATLEGLEILNDYLPQTLKVSTPTGGAHYYLRTDKTDWIPNSTSRLGEGLDIKGDGGYVVGPMSATEHGIYTSCKGEIAPAPKWLTESVKATKPDRSSANLDLDHDEEQLAATRAIEWLKRHAPLSKENDGGDATAYRVAARVMDFGVGADLALEIMLEHWNDRCEPPWEDEQLQVKVENAAAYRHKPIGVDSADAEFEVVELPNGTKDADYAKPDNDDLPVTSANNPFEYQSAKTASGLALTQSAKPLIEGLLDQGAMSMLYAPPGAGKTFITIDLLYHVAAGKPWAGRKVAKGLAVHLAAEGGGGVRKRYKAYDVVHGCGEDLPLVLISVSADLRSNKTDCKRLIATIRAAEAEFGMPCAILAIDTLSRVLAGGDENSSVDGGALVKNVDEVRAAIKAHTMLIHHTGKAEGRGARGWSGFKAALDTELEIRDGALHVTKQRDLEFIDAIPFGLRSVDLGVDSNGNPVTSAVVDLSVVAEEDFDDALTDGEEGALQAFDAAAQHRYGAEWAIGKIGQFISTNEWFDNWRTNSFRRSSVEGSFDGMTLQTLGTFRRGLTEKGLIKQVKRSQWVRMK